MKTMHSAVAVAVVIAFAGCSTHYVPRGPGLGITMERGKIVYVRDGQRFESGVLGGGLVDAVAPNPQARAAAERYNGKMKQGLFMLVGGLVCSAATFGLAVDSAYDDSGDDFSEGYVLTSVGCLVVAYSSAFVFAGAETYRLDAINIFNDGALTAPGHKRAPGWDKY
jgi:hypothetical protein